MKFPDFKFLARVFAVVIFMNKVFAIFILFIGFVVFAIIYSIFTMDDDNFDGGYGF